MGRGAGWTGRQEDLRGNPLSNFFMQSVRPGRGYRGPSQSWQRRPRSRATGCGHDERMGHGDQHPNRVLGRARVCGLCTARKFLCCVENQDIVSRELNTHAGTHTLRVCTSHDVISPFFNLPKQNQSPHLRPLGFNCEHPLNGKCINGVWSLKGHNLFMSCSLRYV